MNSTIGVAHGGTSATRERATHKPEHHSENVPPKRETCHPSARTPLGKRATYGGVGGTCGTFFVKSPRVRARHVRAHKPINPKTCHTCHPGVGR